jgi:transposase
VKVDTSRFLDAIICICENGCTWRALPEAFGPGHTIYVRINRWAKNGVLERIFHALTEEQITNRRITVVSLDSSSVKAHPDGEGPLFLLMDRAYEGWETRRLAFEWGYSPAVPAKKNRKEPWEYDRELYKQRNDVERMFRRLKG